MVRVRVKALLVWEFLWVSVIPSVNTYDILYNFTNNYLSLRKADITQKVLYHDKGL